MKTASLHAYGGSAGTRHYPSLSQEHAPDWLLADSGAAALLRAGLMVVTLDTDQLKALVADAVREALDARDGDSKAELSARGAARLIHRRVGDVLKALQDGAMVGKRRGRRWSTTAAEARTWAASL